MKYKIKYALGGGFGGCENKDWEIIEAANKEEAQNIAYEYACEEYDSYSGMHGIRSIEEIMEEEDCGEDTAHEIYNEERESWLDYEAEEYNGEDLD